MIAAVMYIVAIVYPWLAAKKDAIQIELNGSFDSLKRAFHFVNVWIRVLVFVAIGFLGATSLYGLTSKAFVFLLLYSFVSWASFWFIFDSRLNTLRGLPLGYIGANAKTDLFLLSLSVKLFPRGTTSQIDKAQRLSLWIKILLFVLSNGLFWGYLSLNSPNV